MKAVRFHKFGGPEVLSYEDGVVDPKPGKGEVLIKVAGAGVNFADLMRRSGSYPGTNPPATLGLEAAGIIAAVVAGVTTLKPGDAVMTRRANGGQAEYATAALSDVFQCPAGFDLVHAGGIPVILLTAYHLLKTRFQMQPGETVLIQAGASGVGTIAVQLAKRWGATVITTASTDEKLALTRSLGADVAINYLANDFEDEVKALTHGKGVEVILECVGGEVLEKSLRSLAPYGRLVTYGNSSGSTGTSLAQGEIFPTNRTVVGFSMGRSPDGALDHQSAMAEMLPLIKDGSLRLIVDRIMPMSRVAEAHAHLANRWTLGKVILTPD